MENLVSFLALWRESPDAVLNREPQQSWPQHVVKSDPSPYLNDDIMGICNCFGQHWVGEGGAGFRVFSSIARGRFWPFSQGMCSGLVADGFADLNLADSPTPPSKHGKI